MTELYVGRRANLRFILSHPGHFLAYGFGAGLAPFAPGTFGTLVAFPLHEYLLRGLGVGEHLAVLLVLALAGTWICGHSARALGVADPSGIVWDEIVAFLLVLFFTPPALAWQAAAFALFRFFDAVKPPPVGWCDRNIHGGLGIMVDDLAAAFMTLLCLALWKSMVGG